MKRMARTVDQKLGGQQWISLGAYRFRPAERIKREELAALTERALQAAQKPLKPGDASLLDGYADSADIAAYARGSFTRLIAAGLLTGDGYGLRPAEGATRGEAAVLLYRLYSGGTE